MKARIVLFLLGLILPFWADAMKIVTDEIDAFSGERTVITSWESFDKTQIHLRFRLQNGKQFLDLKFRNGDAIVIGENAELLFKSEDGDISKFNSIALFSGAVGAGSVGLNGSGVFGISATYKGSLEWFVDHAANLMRIYATDTYYDRKISQKEAKKLTDLYSLFSDKLKK